VYTADGLAVIETVQVGDLVWAKDQASGITALKPITELFVTQAKPLYALTTQAADGKLETVEVTDNHPYWVMGTGWVSAVQSKSMSQKRYENWDWTKATGR